jgi:hypothetical protein
MAGPKAYAGSTADGTHIHIDRDCWAWLVAVLGLRWVSRDPQGGGRGGEDRHALHLDLGGAATDALAGDGMRDWLALV